MPRGLPHLYPLPEGEEDAAGPGEGEIGREIVYETPSNLLKETRHTYEAFA